jgi:S-adenosylmethionine hydrolase
VASIISLTTDFGSTGTYVAAMKAVILGINPDVRLVDVCHDIPPQNILKAALAVDSVYDLFPSRTIHLVVIDPGVGTGRMGIVLRTPEADFVAPDNGVLSHVLLRFAGPWSDSQGPLEVQIPGELEAIHLTRPGFWRASISPTFHGRDIFAPVAAWLSIGRQPSEFGERVSRLTVLPVPRRQRTDAEIIGQVVDIDSFGNLVTNIKSEDMQQDRATLTVAVGGRTIRGMVTTYAEGEGLIALIGSTGHLEIAIRNGNAGTSLKAQVGDRVTVRRTP